MPLPLEEGPVRFDEDPVPFEEVPVRPVPLAGAEPPPDGLLGTEVLGAGLVGGAELRVPVLALPPPLAINVGALREGAGLGATM
ncbi:MAG TPA: hypothetical protein VMA77_18465 [Solirubrobacteraceae bacterium]|nr:hypothetical protein [Solirubrobacteraceae bacterium]